MSPRLKSFLVDIGALSAVGFIIIILIDTRAPSLDYVTPRQNPIASSTQTASASAATADVTSSSPQPASTTPKKATPKAKKTVVATSPATVQNTEMTDTNTVSRIENPYPSDPLPLSSVNQSARAALVNIVCAPRTDSLRAISGSGVIIDPRGVILTNAHIAQYVLLSESPRLNISCVVRSGAPAQAHWSVEPFYIPTQWIQEHAADITKDHPTGTGEHDYALLLITGNTDSPAQASGSPFPPATGFPSILPDTRQAVAFVDDPVLAASYPAEFIGGIAAQFDLYPASSVTTIKDLLTFDTSTVDLLSVGGVIEAQSGSSGGAIVNAWNRLVGIITTTSDGATTAQRDLRAITLSYIDRDMKTQTGSDLSNVLSGDAANEASAWNTAVGPTLLKLLLDQLPAHAQ